jgi:hypothetical protein
MKAPPGELLDMSDVGPVEMQRVVQPMIQAGPRKEEFDLGPHVTVKLNMLWGPFGMAEIRFDRIAVDNADRAFTVTNLVRVGVPFPVAVIIAGAITMIKQMASENGVIAFVQLPSLVHWYLPA